MLEVGWVGESMSLKLYALPYFRDETFPGVRGRLRFPLVIDVDNPQFESPYGRWQPSGALRYTLNVGDLDLGVSAFTGTSREPRFLLELSNGEVVPRYDIMHQGSVDMQFTHGALTLKAEVYARLWTQQLKPFGGGGVGLDYSFFKVVGAADLSIALEFLYDSRPPDAPITFFNHDLFAGFRFALNDLSNTEVTAGVVFNVVNASTVAHPRGQPPHQATIGAPTSKPQRLLRAGRRHRVRAFANDSNGQLRIAYFF